MIVATIPYSRLDPGNTLARRYFTEPGGLAELFAYDYRDPRALRPLVEIQGKRDRPRLAELLVKYNQQKNSLGDGFMEYVVQFLPRAESPARMEMQDLRELEG